MNSAMFGTTDKLQPGIVFIGGSQTGGGYSAKLRAVVLRSVDYGERDKVVTLLSRERGKLSAFARGARASRRRFGGVLEPFTLVAAEVSERGGDLWGLEDAAVERAFGAIRGDLLRIACASYAVELAREGPSPSRPTRSRAVDLAEEGL
jgi:recombinational DNA repair protein (RecF pathway)